MVPGTQVADQLLKPICPLCPKCLGAQLMEFVCTCRHVHIYGCDHCGATLRVPVSEVERPRNRHETPDAIDVVHCLDEIRPAEP